MSTIDGAFDALSFLVFFPVMTGWGLGLGAGMRWLDRARGREDLWD